jgi:hypothetical protein
MHYVMDARQRLFGSLPAVVPRRGSQFACLIESHDIASITSVKGWEGIDLATFNALQDTTSMVFTKQYGFRFSSCEYRGLADKQGVLSVDFGADAVGIWRTERRVRFQVIPSPNPSPNPNPDPNPNPNPDPNPNPNRAARALPGVPSSAAQPSPEPKLKPKPEAEAGTRNPDPDPDH